MTLGLLIGSGLALSAPEAKLPSPAPNLGNVLYIGDSITHGYGAPSYRWALHKILVDNGVKYQEIGIESGNNGQYLKERDGSYRGVPFQNIHAAMSSQRAYETSGRKHVSGRLGGTDILDWLKLPGADKSDRQLMDKPDTCFILLGTNDTLSDYGRQGGIAQHIDEATQALTNPKNGDIPAIIDAIRQANPKAKIILFPVPTWGETSINNTPEDYKSIMTVLNPQYAALAKEKKVIFVDLNQGLIDLSQTEKPGMGVSDFFNASDHLHPSPQGDLIIAGLTARALGYAGRTAGLPRKAASDFSQKAADIIQGAKGVTLQGRTVTLAPNACLDLEMPEGRVAGEFSLEFTPKVGNGATDGWDNKPLLTISIWHSPIIYIYEDGIYLCEKNNKKLLPRDMSTNTEPLRIAFVNPKSWKDNIKTGCYVWLGDMCIGEAVSTPTLNEERMLLQAGDSSVQISDLSYDPKKSYAPRQTNNAQN